MPHATSLGLSAELFQDGYVDFLLTTGVVALSSPDPNDQCLIAGEAVLAGPPVGPVGEPQWGYACVLVTDDGLIDAETATREQVVRNWRTADSLATIVDLRGDGQPGFAAIDKSSTMCSSSGLVPTIPASSALSTAASVGASEMSAFTAIASRSGSAPTRRVGSQPLRLCSFGSSLR